jgi:peptidoglycan hydrolase-like protein with peptidoglycan-binding domain
MNVVVARLLFLGFIGLTGLITYNALYLQEQRSIAVLPTAPKAASKPATTSGSGVVSADLPPLPAQKPPSQLVTAIQRELKVRGYGGGAADGTLREETRKAIADYQRDHGLAISGLPSDELLHHILLGETVSTGSVAAAADAPDSAPRLKEDIRVKAVQQILADLGYAPGPVDGAMGSATEHAVKAFQHDRKIAETGSIGPELLREIKRVTGRDLAGVASR